jgi:hypothetical protein
MTDQIPPPPEGAKPVDGPCPICGASALHIEVRLTAAPIGTFSIPGAQPKIAASSTAHLVCRSCKAETQGVIEPGHTHARFNPKAMKIPTSTEDQP